MANIIGRTLEQKKIKSLLNSKKAEFLAVYGRRRIGKTFLVREFFDNKFDFTTTGVIDAGFEEQIFAFTSSLRSIGYDGPNPKDWMMAFDILKSLLEKKSQDKRVVIFIDELPCFDTAKSGFLNAFGHFWNSWANWNKNIFLIVCGSATSWIIENIVNNRAGLHNRITAQIHLHQFTLKETEDFFESKKCRFTRQMVLQYFMALGGVPYYLGLVEPMESFAQFIDRTFFSNGDLAEEYKRLFASLYRQPDSYTKVLEFLSKKKEGFLRIDIAKGLNCDNGHLSKILSDLEYCDFIRTIPSVDKNFKPKKNGQFYQLSDFFVQFYYTFGKFIKVNPIYWQQNLNTSLVNNWFGHAYERVVMCFSGNVKKAIGIDKIQSFEYAWRGADSSGQNVQIDFIIHRADNIINLCEIKYSFAEYEMSKTEYLKIQRRIDVFRNARKTRSSICPVMITTYGMTQGGYSSEFPIQITMEDLF